MQALIIFSFVSFNLTSISILQPPQAKEAYIVTQFQDDLGSFHDNAVWPENYERMYLNRNQDSFYTTFNHKLPVTYNQTFLRYQVRLFFSNRSYTDSAWMYSTWNKRNFSSHYNDFVTILLLSFTCFVLIIALIIICMKIKHF